MFKLIAKLMLCLTLMFTILSAAIPLHNIFHKHHFVQLDDCGLNTCDQHLKNDSDHCHTHSDAVFFGEIPQQNIALALDQPIRKVTTFFKDDNYFQFFYLTKNKAPPLKIIA